MVPRVGEMLDRFQLQSVADSFPDDLPLGIRQRLSLAAAVVHRPQILILDEPTSGVDPVARDGFWELIIELSRRDRVTIFITTHFMNEAERCDRISLMHAGKSLACDTPAALVKARGAETLEDAFIGYLRDADPESGAEAEEKAVLTAVEPKKEPSKFARFFPRSSAFSAGTAAAGGRISNWAAIRSGRRWRCSARCC